MTDPNILYKDTLKRLNVTADELGHLMEDYLKEYIVEINHTSDFQNNVSRGEFEKRIKEKLISQLTRDIMNGDIFPSKLTQEYIPYNDTWKTSLKFEVFDFRKFDILFRPERCI